MGTRTCLTAPGLWINWASSPCWAALLSGPSRRTSLINLVLFPEEELFLDHSLPIDGRWPKNLCRLVKGHQSYIATHFM